MIAGKPHLVSALGKSMNGPASEAGPIGIPKNRLAQVFAIRHIANMSSTSTVSTRLDKQDLALIKALAELEGCDRATLVKSLLRKGMAHLRREHAIRAFRRDEVSLSKAAELAGLDLWDFLALMESEKLDIHYDVADFEQDLSQLPAIP